MAELVTKRVQALLNQMGSASREHYADCRLQIAEIARTLEQEKSDAVSEIAELRRWLGAAAKEVRAITRHSIGYESVDASVFDAISRGESVSEDVRRMYLGDEE